MARYGAMFAGADVVILGAPFDGGTSHRPGARFGPQAIRSTDYLPPDGSRPSLALRVDGLTDLRLLDAVRRLCLSLPIVGLDVVEVSPPYDHADITAALANRVVLEALSAIAHRRQGLTFDPARPLLHRRGGGLG